MDSLFLLIKFYQLPTPEVDVLHDHSLCKSPPPYFLLYFLGASAFPNKPKSKTCRSGVEDSPPSLGRHDFLFVCWYVRGHTVTLKRTLEMSLVFYRKQITCYAVLRKGAILSGED